MHPERVVIARVSTAAAAVVVVVAAVVVIAAVVRVFMSLLLGHLFQ
jgi:hypothetical protein